MNRDDVMLDDTEILHDGFFRMEHFLFRHRLYEGGWSPQLSREILVRSPVAAVVPYDPVRDEIVLIEQFRGGIYASGDENPWSVEIVAGIIEPGETAAEMAVREAKEEAGCVMTDVEKILDFIPAPEGLPNTLHCIGAGFPQSALADFMASQKKAKISASLPKPPTKR
jgi:ADP-ribose pyrophosphatase